MIRGVVMGQALAKLLQDFLMFWVTCELDHQISTFTAKFFS
jgi:hypothetical protein